MAFPDFLILFLGHNTQNMQHLFTFLAPRNLNRKTLELFFSLNQRLSIWPFGRRVQGALVYGLIYDIPGWRSNEYCTLENGYL